MPSGARSKRWGRTDERIVVVDGDVGNSTRTEWFAADFPERFFNVGIAESNLVGVAGGLAGAGKIPVAASFACFLMCNAFDQLRMAVAFPWPERQACRLSRRDFHWRRRPLANGY